VTSKLSKGKITSKLKVVGQKKDNMSGGPLWRCQSGTAEFHSGAMSYAI